MSRTQMKISGLTAKSLGYNNCVYLNPEDMQKLNLKDMELVLIDEVQVFPVKTDPKLPVGSLGTGNLARRSLHLSPAEAIGKIVTIESFDTSKQNKNAIAQSVALSSFKYFNFKMTWIMHTKNTK